MFTAKQIENLKPREKTYQVREGKGFGIRIFPSGEKVWFFAYKFHNRQRMMTLGPYPELKLADARKTFRDARELVAKGVDPLATKQQERVEPTVTDMVEEYLTRHVSEKAPRSLKEYRRNLEKDVIPVWGKLRVKDITRRDVHVLLEKILDRGAKNQANQVFKIVRAMFNWSVPRYGLDYSPCSHVKLPAKENKKDRFLSEIELSALWQELDKARMSDSIKKVLRLILTTGQRPGEVIGLHSKEIDGDWWTIPPERAKNGKKHRVFLSPLAKALIGELPEGLLFPSPRSDKPIEVNALAKAVRRNSLWAQKKIQSEKSEKTGMDKFFFSIETPWTPHDLRRTCATYLAKAGHSDEVIGRVLNHTRAGITSRYNRYQYDKEIQAALTTWSRKLESIITGKASEKVIPFTG